MQIVSYAEKEPGRFKRGRGWKVNLFGQNSDVPGTALQAFRIDMSANMELDSHFHIVDQFQVFIGGSGCIGRDRTDMITVHYADHHTGYGPLIADANGMSYLTLRPKTDAGLVKLSTPNVREQLRPTKRRHRVSSQIIPAIPPVLQAREELSMETVVEAKPGDDGMTVTVVRMGPDMQVPAPATDGTGGYYVIVMNGSLVHEGLTYEPWSLMWVAHTESAPLLTAGAQGLEALITVFPVWDEWMAQVGED
jgi:hypothetical protein